jgi:mono/diheme cytochrome c family protein
MLPALLFAAFWVVLGLGLFLVAVRGGPGGVRAALQTQRSGGRLALNVSFLVAYVGFGVALPVVFLTGNHANASAQFAGLKLTAAEKSGRELFGQNCGICHTLMASNSVGKVGPDLDQIQPSESLTLHTINNGCLQNASAATGTSNQTCLGQGTMPAQILQGKQAQDVAQFVARVAGKT